MKTDTTNERYRYEVPVLKIIETFKNGAMPAMTEEEGGWLLGQLLDVIEQIRTEERERVAFSPVNRENT